MLTSSPYIDISPVVLIVWRLFSNRYPSNNSWDVEESLTLYLKSSLSEYRTLGLDFIFWFTLEGIQCCYWKFFTILFSFSHKCLRFFFPGVKRIYSLSLMTNHFIRLSSLFSFSFPRYTVCTLFIYFFS